MASNTANHVCETPGLHVSHSTLSPRQYHVETDSGCKGPHQICHHCHYLHGNGSMLCVLNFLWLCLLIVGPAHLPRIRRRRYCFNEANQTGPLAFDVLQHFKLNLLASSCYVMLPGAKYFKWVPCSVGLLHAMHQAHEYLTANGTPFQLKASQASFRCTVSCSSVCRIRTCKRSPGPTPHRCRMPSRSNAHSRDTHRQTQKEREREREQKEGEETHHSCVNVTPGLAEL